VSFEIELEIENRRLECVYVGVAQGVKLLEISMGTILGYSEAHTRESKSKAS